MRTVLRSGLVLLAVVEGVPGLWAALAPLAFYRGFPTPAHAWITMFPPYNEHMTFDFGLAVLQFVPLLGYAAVVLRPGLVRITLIASLVFSVPHLLYHQRHLVAGSDLALQLASQLAPIVLALILFVLNERLAARRTPDRAALRPDSS